METSTSGDSGRANFSGRHSEVITSIHAQYSLAGKYIAKSHTASPVI